MKEVCELIKEYVEIKSGRSLRMDFISTIYETCYHVYYSYHEADEDIWTVIESSVNEFETEAAAEKHFINELKSLLSI